VGTPRQALPAILLAGVLLTPFLHSAYTIDDTFFLTQARQVLEHPFDPSGFEIAWLRRVDRASRLAPTGPGMAYILAPTLAVGGAEWAAHLTQLLFLAAAALALVRLATLLSASPAEARLMALLLVACPAVLGMAGTAMPDVPAMALGLVGLERSVAFRSVGGALRGLSAGVCLGAAILVRSHSVMLLPVAALLLGGLQRGEQSFRLRSRVLWPAALALWPLAMALGVAVSVAWLTRDAQAGRVSLLTAIDFIRPATIGVNLVAFFCNFVLVVPLAPAWLILHPRSFSPKLLLLASGLAGLALFQREQLDWWWAAPLAGFGAAACIAVLRSAWRSRDETRLALVLWAFAALPVCVYNHLPAKFMVMSVPAVVMLIVFEARGLAPLRRRGLAAGMLLGGALLGVAILQADARLAELGRSAADRLVRPLVGSGQSVWYSGHWGFQWYAEAAGARHLDESAQPGDRVVASPYRMGALRRWSRRRLAALPGGDSEPGGRVMDMQLGDSEPGGRVMDMQLGVGFYSNEWGYLPWWWSSNEVDRFHVWEIVARPPQH